MSRSPVAQGVGFGPPPRLPAKTFARGLGIADAVTFLGACPPSVVQAEMRGARCFVQHSIEAADGDSEGTPVAVLEAGASGLPVVSTRHGGIPDVVVDGRTGFLVDEHDVPAMAERMLRLARDPGLAELLGRAGRERVANEFALPRSIGRLWDVIAACIDAQETVPIRRAALPARAGCQEPTL